VQKPRSFYLFISHKHCLYFRLCPSVVQSNVVIALFFFFLRIEHSVYFYSAVTAGQLERLRCLLQKRAAKEDSSAKDGHIGYLTVCESRVYRTHFTISDMFVIIE